MRRAAPRRCLAGSRTPPPLSAARLPSQSGTTARLPCHRLAGGIPCFEMYLAGSGPATLSRRWCHFEMYVASILKDRRCLLDLSQYMDRRDREVSHCQSNMSRTRPPLTSPEQMARELREKAFTNGADVDVVASLYQEGPTLHPEPEPEPEP